MENSIDHTTNLEKRVQQTREKEEMLFCILPAPSLSLSLFYFCLINPESLPLPSPFHLLLLHMVGGWQEACHEMEEEEDFNWRRRGLGFF